MKSLLFTLLAACLTFSISAQTADAIIAKHIEAIGGKEKLSQIKTLYTEGVMEVMGNEAPIKTSIINGKAYKMELEIMGSTIVQCLTDKGGWGVNPLQSTDVVDVPEEQAKASAGQFKIGGSLLDYAENGTKVELKGKKTINKKEYFEILATSKADKTVTFLIDSETYYVFSMEAKGEMMGQAVTIVTNFSDYKKTDSGYVMPYTTELDTGQMQMTSKVKNVEVNKVIDEAVFAKPK